MARIYHGLLYFSILKGEKIVKAINTSVFSHNSTISRNFVFWPDVLRASIYPQLGSLYAVKRYLCRVKHSSEHLEFFLTLSCEHFYLQN